MLLLPDVLTRVVKEEMPHKVVTAVMDSGTGQEFKHG